MLPGAGGYRVTRVTDKELLTQSQQYAMMHSICAMQENQHKCVEEIRFDAYAKAGEPSPQGASPGAFGQPANSATPFGASPTSGFGATAATGGGFGSSALNSPLGGSTGGFFAPVAAASPFGATGSAFGAISGNASPFGVTAPSAAGAFGNTTQTGAFGGAGANMGVGGMFGVSNTPSGSAFGAPPSTSTFGSAPAPAFGSNSAGPGGSLFGTSPTTPGFGGATISSTNLFGGANSGSTFGAAASAPGFGSAASAPSFGGSAGAFGMPASTPAFGGSALGGSVFGAPASNSAFGAAQTSPAFNGGGAFGAPAGSVGFGAGPTSFGAAASSSAFGVSTGTPATNPSPVGGSTNLFGASAPAGGAFGAPSPSTGGMPPFGAAQASSGLFGATASAPQASAGFGAAAPTPSFGGFTSTPASSPSLFGTAGAPATGTALSLGQPAASTPSFSFSAASAPATGGMFSSGARPTGMPSFGATLPSTSLIGGGSVLPSTPTPLLFGAAPSYPSPLGGGMSATGAFTPGAAVNASSLAPTGNVTLASPSVNAAPYGNSLAVPPPVITPVSTAKQSHKKSLLGSTSPNAAHVAFPVRSLTPRSPWLTTRGGLTSRMKPRGYSASPSPHGGDFVHNTVVDAPTGSGGSTPPKLQAADNWMFKPRENPRSLFIRKPPAMSPPTSSLLAVNPISGTLSQATESDTIAPRNSGGKRNETPERRHVHFEDENIAEPSLVQNALDVSNNSGENIELEDELPVISTQDGYSIEPSREVLQVQLEEKGEKALARVEDFVVTRKNFGSVRWLEPVDVRRLEIDRVVRIERGVIYVYHENSGVLSPPPGEGLKKRAEVTLYECRPKKEGEAARAKFEDRILKQTRRMGGELQEYSAETGLWRFTLQL